MAAVGLVAQSRDAASIEQAGLLYAEAMADFTTVMQQKGTQTLQCLLFVLLWSLISPATQGLPLLGSPAAPPWHTSGLCMRMCVDLGIHTEAMIQSSTSAGDIMGRALRRRLFWVASKMDQSLGALLGRPPAWHEPRPQEQTVASFQQDETVATQRANSTTANSSTVQKIHADQAMDEALWDSSELYDSFCNTPEGTWNTDESTEILATWDG
ncbi:hypothetical protein SBRCBS47491_001484 [Sporothrix bragantina]|uniref:Xylanolytic transcriptional activator regulatory domain-containing protein n=1 Tax=Sporothrix bragantina TaxID=671064 RepID=A0ABP0AZ75_9PEZI